MKCKANLGKAWGTYTAALCCAAAPRCGAVPLHCWLCHIPLRPVLCCCAPGLCHGTTERGYCAAVPAPPYHLEFNCNLDIYKVLRCSVVSDSLQTHGLQSARLLCPWNVQARKWVGCHFLLQGIFPNQGSNPHLLHLLGNYPLSKRSRLLCIKQFESTATEILVSDTAA